MSKEFDFDVPRSLGINALFVDREGKNKDIKDVEKRFVIKDLKEVEKFI